MLCLSKVKVSMPTENIIKFIADCRCCKVFCIIFAYQSQQKLSFPSLELIKLINYKVIQLSPKQAKFLTIISLNLVFVKLQPQQNFKFEVDGPVCDKITDCSKTAIAKAR